MINNDTVILLSKAKQSKAKQSKAKLLLYLLNNFKFYILQFFKTLKFLGVRFALQNIFSLIKRIRHYEGNARSNLFNSRLLQLFHSFAMTVKNNFAILNLVKSFLTSITFDSLSRKIKNPCLVIDRNSFLKIV